MTRYAPSDILAICPPPTAPPQAAVRTASPDLIERAKRARNGEAFTRLWNGDVSGYESHSEADLALCRRLVFWTGGDAAEVDRLFRRSKLMRPKWDERHGDRTYGKRTIDKALEGATEFYKPPPPPPMPLDDLLARCDLIPEDISTEEATADLHALLELVARLPTTVQTILLDRIKQRTGIPLRDLRPTVTSHIRAALLERRTTASADPDACPYRATPAGLVRDEFTTEGEISIPLTNFNVKIVCTAFHDDGVEERRFIELVATIRGRKISCSVRAEDFGRLEWVLSALGPNAVVWAGPGTRDHARAAIQALSPEAPERTVYKHTGWRNVKGIGWCYLHAGGAVGPMGLIHTVEVDLPGVLSNYTLPEPPVGDELVASVRSAIGLLELAPRRIMVPLFAGIWRAAIRTCDFSLYLEGGTGVLKTALAAILQAFWGPGFHDRNLPAAWSSTGNALEMLAFLIKDAILVIDDFAPTGSRVAVQQMHATADRVLRGQGNNAGRARMTADAHLHTTRYARGLILSTGEELPAGHSLRARTLFLSVSAGDIDVVRLTACQAAARSGQFAATLSGFLKYVAADYPATLQRIKARAHELRDQLHRNSRHRRVAAIEAELLSGLEVFLDFAVAVRAISRSDVEQHLALARAAMGEVAAAQAAHQRNADPAEEFLSLLSAAFVAGEAHIEAIQGGRPQFESVEMLGWQSQLGGSGGRSGTSYISRGDRVGWLEDGNLYLELAAAYRTAQRMSADGGGLSVTRHTLGKLLSERGYLLSEEGKRDKHEVRKVIQGRRRYVLHLSVDSVIGRSDQAHQAQSGPSDNPDPEQHGDVGPSGQDLNGSGPAAASTPGCGSPAGAPAATSGRFAASVRAEAVLRQAIRSGREPDIRAARNSLVALVGDAIAARVEAEVQAELKGAADE